MYKLEYGKESIKIYKNISPFLSGTPLWDIVGEYFKDDNIPEDILNILEDEIKNNILWFFEDMS